MGYHIRRAKSANIIEVVIVERVEEFTVKVVEVEIERIIKKIPQAVIVNLL